MCSTRMSDALIRSFILARWMHPLRAGPPDLVTAAACFPANAVTRLRTVRIRRTLSRTEHGRRRGAHGGIGSTGLYGRPEPRGRNAEQLLGDRVDDAGGKPRRAGD